MIPALCDYIEFTRIMAFLFHIYDSSRSVHLKLVMPTCSALLHRQPLIFALSHVVPLELCNVGYSKDCIRDWKCRVAR